MLRVASVLEEACAGKRKALTLFLTAGYPRAESTPDLVPALADAGADVIEIGIPFSDPLADGPVIQESSMVALKNGVTLETILRDVRTIRSASTIPLVLMGYLNPILSYGAERFFLDASEAGIDGLILPELPLEESNRYRSSIDSHRLAQILLVTPTTPVKRIAAIDEASSGFLYCVSTTGVTGQVGMSAREEYLDRVKSIARKNRVLVGFGISTPETARQSAAHADGVIVGSALIRRIASGENQKDTLAWVRSLKDALVS
jgi:tryptophan synthase alpha chain